MVVRYGEKIITLPEKELRLDLAYHCKIGILEYSGELEDIRRLQEINEHVKKEQNSLKFQYRIGQRDVLKWVLEE